MSSKFIGILIGVVSLIVGFGAGRLSAGSPDAPGGPNSGAAQMYTLEQLYQRLNSGASTAKMTQFTEPGTAPGTGTMHTLDDIMGIAPTLNNNNGVTSTNVLTGTTFWGLNAMSGQWGLQTGTAALGSNISGSNGLKTFNIPNGLYSRSKTATANDTNLISGNIKSGITIFSVAGTYPYAGVPKSGQSPTLPINPAPTGSDGALQKGVAWPIPRFITSTAGIVTDTLTGLIWLQDTHCTATVGGISGGFLDWTSALTWTNSLASGSCGLTDGSTAGQWHLPTAPELLSLVHYGFYSPALPNTAGTGKFAPGDPFIHYASEYWSSTSYAADTSQAFDLYLDNGYEILQAKTFPRGVWPVRGGP